jgi:phosphoglycolate phosphatase
MSTARQAARDRPGWYSRRDVVTHVVWDWNGTLLDDVTACLDALNSLLVERRLPALDRASYRARFGFPVRDFYSGLGFDFVAEDFLALSREFLARYRARLAPTGLQRGALETMADLGARGLGQVVLSAMEVGLLGTMLAEYRVRPHLADFFGLPDEQSSSKTARGVEMMRELALHPAQVVIVGDTLHDVETARAIGCRCVLFSGGHQSRDRFPHDEVTVIDDLGDLRRALA